MSSDSSNSFGCNDIPGGFQGLNPQIFNIIGEILGDVMAGRLPFNVQNAVGNWIQLVGQIIETNSSQQQYFQGGPGRYFNPKYYNVSNPFCQSDSEEKSNNDFTVEKNKESSNNTITYEDTLDFNNSETDQNYNITDLILIINDLKKDINDIQCRLNTIEKRKV